MLFENLSRWFCHSLNTLKTKESTEPDFPVNSQFTLGIGMIFQFTQCGAGSNDRFLEKVVKIP